MGFPVVGSGASLVRVFAIAAALAAVSGAAQAQVKAKPLDFTVRAEPTSAAPDAGKRLKWDAAKGRWGLTFNLDQTETRPSTLGDAEAGAYYRITPSLRVGGAVSLGEQDFKGAPAKVTPGEGQPRVRLETKLKF